MTVQRFTVEQWVGYHTHLGERMHRAAVRGLANASVKIIALLVERTRAADPASPGGAFGATDTNTFLRAWHVVPDGMGLRIYNSMPYAGVIEYGRRPGSKQPPKEPIERWLMSRGGMTASKARATAWVVARAIGIRGLRGRHILTAPEATAQIVDIVETSINDEIAREIGRPR